MNLTVLTPADLDGYEEAGYIHAKGVLPGELLKLCREVLEQWVDTMVAHWREDGRLADPHEDLGFRSRFLACWREAGMPRHERSPRRQLVQLAPRKMYEILRHAERVGHDALVHGHAIRDGRRRTRRCAEAGLAGTVRIRTVPRDALRGVAGKVARGKWLLGR